MKHRDIKKDEINKITEECKTFREKAFFTIMRQSGLPPHTIKQLKIRHLPKILDPYTPIPYKINVPQEKFPTFIGKEAIKYLKQYLTTRPDKLRPESLLFCTHKKPNTQVNTKNISRSFQLIAQKLKKERKITYEVRRGKPSELRLYSLIKFYRKNAKYYLTELDKNQTPKNDEFYRKLYEEKAMPYLEIELPTPIQIHQLEKQQQELENKLKKIEDILPEEPRDYTEARALQDDYGIWLEKHPEEFKQIKKQLKKRREDEKKWRKEHPEEAKLQDEQEEKERKEADEYLTKLHINDLEERVKELENKLKKVENIIKKPRKTEQKEIHDVPRNSDDT